MLFYTNRIQKPPPRSVIKSRTNYFLSSSRICICVIKIFILIVVFCFAVVMEKVPAISFMYEEKLTTLKRQLTSFFSVSRNFQVLLKLVKLKRSNGGSKVSLRLLEFTCTNPLLQNWKFKNSKNEYVCPMIVHSEKLACNGKQFFDAFRRGRRVVFNGVETTYGQLNFIKWVIEDEILDNVTLNLFEIKNLMKTPKSPNKKKRGKYNVYCTAVQTDVVVNYKPVKVRKVER